MHDQQASQLAPLCPRCRSAQTQVAESLREAPTIVRGLSVRAVCVNCKTPMDVEVRVRLEFETTEVPS